MNNSIFDKTKYFIIDMDGTFYLGDNLLEGSLDFLEKLDATGRKSLFVTNNSSKSADVYVKKLEKKWSGFYIRFDYGNGKCQYFPAMPVQMEGSCGWTGFKFRVKTPEDFNKNKKAYISFILRKASGTAWVDHVSVREVTK